MWSIEQLEEIRDDCLADLVNVFPNMEDKLFVPRIEINHKRVSTLALYSAKTIQISAYLLSATTTRIFFQTLIMKGLVKGQLRLRDSDLAYEQTISILQEKYSGKYDFEEYKDYKKHHVELPQQTETYKYAVHCPRCGQIFRYKRICKTVISPQDYICTKCKVSLERL